MTPRLSPCLLAASAAAIFAHSSAAQTLLSVAQADVTSALQSSGYNCWSGASWNDTVPVGPLPLGATTLTNSSWVLSASGLSVSSSASSNLCSFYQPASSGSNSGTVEVRLVSPFDMMVTVKAIGSATAPPSPCTGPLCGSATTSSVAVDGVVVATLSSGTTGSGGVNQSTQVLVGPAGVVIRVQHTCSMSVTSALAGGSASANLSVSWTPLDGAAVTSIPGGCAAPTPTPTLAANGLPTLGGAMDMSVLGAQGPAPLGFVMFGLEQALIPLDGIGMTGCTALQPQWLSLIAQPVGPTTLHLNVPLPNQPWLVGVQLYTQAFTQAIGANPRDLVAGNGLEWRIGT